MKPQKFSVRRRLRSFVFAWNGVRLLFHREHNAWIHAVAAAVVLALSWWQRLSAMEWIAVLFAIALVWITELINTSLEKAMDHLSPRLHPHVKEIKDLAAGAVLIAALVAVATGCIIFIPKIIYEKDRIVVRPVAQALSTQSGDRPLPPAICCF